MFLLREINSHTAFSVDRKVLAHIAAAAKDVVAKKQNGTCTVVFVDDATIQDFNARYRENNSVTDVLSFGYRRVFSRVRKGEVVGEIILCESKILSQAIEHGHSPEAETYRLVIHGLTHILGYDHEDESDYEKMIAVERDMLKILATKTDCIINE